MSFVETNSLLSARSSHLGIRRNIAVLVDSLAPSWLMPDQSAENISQRRFFSIYLREGCSGGFK
jgi:hypothetical protein